ncbi:hypothetical protein [Thermoflexibacter ruber]|uniref:Uncharacterized protein n=1 Tax=Thermoflexibacter ruber TaxID=1003 RepID=A0A1I2KDJ2_9BACT|nr:hypothetical protein [Thermoflexibacter ruber]SFF65115.1 hypothetical protein SAMN04488541_11162 [Thermoflexibacter ruber]
MNEKEQLAKLKAILAKHDYLGGNLYLTSNDACLLYVCICSHLVLNKNEPNMQAKLLGEKVLAFARQFDSMNTFIETLNFN